MRILEALKVLEDATLDCKKREIDTPKVHEALDTLERYLPYTGNLRLFRKHLKAFGRQEWELEGQQQNLRPAFGGIYLTVRRMLDHRVAQLNTRYLKTKDPTLKKEIDRVTAALKGMPKRWEFYVR